MSKIIGLILGITVLGFLIFVLSPLLILFGWNNVGNEVLGWPRIGIFHALVLWLTVWALGGTARGGVSFTSKK